jgi:hypothetical protein
MYINHAWRVWLFLGVSMITKTSLISEMYVIPKADGAESQPMLLSYISSFCVQLINSYCYLFLEVQQRGVILWHFTATKTTKLALVMKRYLAFTLYIPSLYFFLSEFWITWLEGRYEYI